MDTTPRSNRVSIAFFGLRNAGKSTLVNAFTGQDIAIVSDTPGTTTDPVSKAMEILPLGPCLITDTAGLDDVGELGGMRVKKTLRVLETADIAVWVDSGEVGADGVASAKLHSGFLEECRRRGVVALEYRRGDSVEELKKRIASVKIGDVAPGLLDGLVEKGDRVVCVCPIDESAPKGRLILPQVQLIRDCLDRHIAASVCQPEELAGELSHSGGGNVLVVTDSQKGDLDEFTAGLKAIGNLKDGDTVLVAEGCTHHRQCNDIGTVKIPKAVERLSGRKLSFAFASGNTFDLPDGSAHAKPALVVHCGGCMLTRREVLRRVAAAKSAGVPIVNYGILLAAASGVDIPVCNFNEKMR